MYNGKCPRCNYPRFQNDSVSIQCLNCFNNITYKVLDKEQLINILLGKQENEIQSLKKEFQHLSNDCKFYKNQLNDFIKTDFKEKCNLAEDYAINLSNKQGAKDAILSLMHDINRDVNEYLNNQ
jgi:hypothetical protein